MQLLRGQDANQWTRTRPSRVGCACRIGNWREANGLLDAKRALAEGKESAFAKAGIEHEEAAT